MFYSRTERVIGSDKVKKLANAKVAVFGVGGVGGYVAECLARSGVGKIVLVDGDVVDISNVNRQIIALQDVVGQSKVQLMAERIAKINPKCQVETYNFRFGENTLDKFSFDYDYIADCIDSVDDKQLLILSACQRHIHIISAMGAGNRYGVPNYVLTDIYKTSYDPLAKLMRRWCATAGIKKLNVVYSKDASIKQPKPVGSIVYHPMAMACMISGKIVNDIIGD